MNTTCINQPQPGHRPYLHAVLALTLLLTSVVACADNKPSIPADWKTECIGKYQISLPGNVEVAVTQKEAFIPNASGYLSRPDIGFADDSGTGSGRARFNVDSEIHVSPILSYDHYKKYTSYLMKQWTRLRDEDVEAGNMSKEAYENEYPAPMFLNPNLLGYIGLDEPKQPNGVGLHLYTHQRIIKIGGSVKDRPTTKKQIADDLLSRFSYREVFEIPSSTGVCFPYGFLKTTPNTDFIKIGVGMRLLDHPDVEIFFKHSTVGEIPASRDSEGEVKWFWSTYGPTKGNKLDGVVDHYHHIDLAGYPAVYATADIARPDASVPDTGQPMESYEQFNKRMKNEMAQGKYPLDYGFMAYYHSNFDPNIKEEPYLTLYVIRTASRAIAAGKKPVTRDELYTMAKQIAASIKLKPVQ